MTQPPLSSLHADDPELASTIARVLDGASMATAAWLLFYPRPYVAAVLVVAAIPLAALAAVALFRGLIAVDGRSDDPRPHVVLALIMPGAALAVRALLDVDVVDSGLLFLLSAPFAIALTAAGAWLDRGARQWALTAALYAGMNLVYCASGLCIANALLDTAEPVTHHATVLQSSASRGKRVSYRLKLSPWGPVTEAEKVEVDRYLQELVDEGDEVEVRLHPGAFGVRWFEVGLASEARSTPRPPEDAAAGPN